MRHLDDDELLRLTLDLLEGEERSVCERHIQECAECRTRWKVQDRSVELVGSVRPRVLPLPLRLPVFRRHSSAPWLKLAAMLVLGFMGGILTAEWWFVAPPHVIGSHMQGTTRASSIIPSDATAGIEGK